MLRKRILIIEDETEIADTLVYIFKAEGMEPLWVNSAKSALEKLDAEAFDFAILDVGLPDANGFDLFKRIREQHNIPMIFLTARSEEIDRIIGLEIGADDYVTKPFSPREVVARVKNIIKRTAPDATAPQNIEVIIDTSKNDNATDFLIDSDSLNIRYKGTVLKLTRTEYLLLEVLIKSPYQIFSRRQLIEAVWSHQHPSDDRAIDSHIKSLRQSFKRIEEKEIPIITYRGFGYSLFKSL